MDVQTDVGGAQDMAGGMETERRASGKPYCLAEVDGREMLHRPLRVPDAVERLGRLVSRQFVPVEKLSVLFLQMAAVHEDQLGNISGGARHIDFTTKTFAHETR